MNLKIEVIKYLFFQFQDFRFLCPNDTVFDQQNLVCTNWFEVDCRQSVQLFAQDFGFRAEEEQRQTDPGRGNIARYITFQIYTFFICFIFWQTIIDSFLHYTISILATMMTTT